MQFALSGDGPRSRSHKGSVNKLRDILEGNSGVSENAPEREGTDSGQGLLLLGVREC